MAHRAETILEAVKSTLTGLGTTAENVERARIWPVDFCPALSIERGTDQPLGGSGLNVAFQDRQLQVAITAYVKVRSSSNPETELNQIAAEVYTAMFADVTHGLAFVFTTEWLGDGQPELTQDQEARTAKMRMMFGIEYRHSLTSPES